MKEPQDLAEAQALALAIVDTLPEPFLVLDDTLHLLAGSRCFYEVFGEDPSTAHGRPFFELSGGQWDIPGLRQLLAAVVDDRTTVDSFEFERVMSVAAVQSYLHASDGIQQIEMGPYLTKLSSGLASSMVDPKQHVDITVSADAGALPSSHAVSIGLIVTELIINAVKYAFPAA